jgi:hypothetical protein
MTKATRNLADLIERLMRATDAAGPVRHYGINTDLVSFSKEGLGGLLLTDEDAKQYRQCVDDIYAQTAGKDEHISRSAVESIIQQTMLRALDPLRAAPEKDFSRRLASTFARMEQELREEPTEWEVHFPVDGLMPENLPYKFGKCTFYLADDAFMSSLVGRLSTVFGSDGTDSDGIRKLIAGRTGVVTRESAVDRDAAALLARHRIRQTVDILSFYANLGGSPRSQIVFAEDAGPKILSSFLFSEKRADRWMPSERVGPIAPFSFAAPFLDRAGFSKASEILQSEKLSEFQERIVSALQWAGRASVEARSEQAFLLFAIALESLVMGRNDKSEITETLALRAAHLIASPQGRLKVYQDLKKLYGVRSKIVHTGEMDVGEAQLSLFRFLVRMALLRMLHNSRFATMASDSELMDWFRAQLLDTPTQ